MSAATAKPAAVELDVRQLEPRHRHATIFQILADLGPGEALAIVNDHDPTPLRYQLDAEQPGRFAWTYVEHGPEVWRVEIARPAVAE